MILHFKYIIASAYKASDCQISNFFMTKRSMQTGVFLKPTVTITSYKDDRFSQTPNVESCRTINHRIQCARCRDFFPSVSPTVAGSNSWKQDDPGRGCALLWFNPLLEGQVEIRNSYDSLPTFVRVRARSRAGIRGGESTLQLLSEGRRLHEVGKPGKRKINPLLWL